MAFSVYYTYQKGGVTGPSTTKNTTLELWV